VVCGGHANVDDKPYNPPVAPGMFYRWKPRNICELCRKNGVKPKLHMSVLERVAHGTEDYWPGDLPPGAGVVFTEPTNGHGAVLQRRASHIERELASFQAAHEASDDYGSQPRPARGGKGASRKVPTRT
jgi:hypothetical protein